jgi:membrane-bound serine protease (ClpP class)
MAKRFYLWLVFFIIAVFWLEGTARAQSSSPKVLVLTARSAVSAPMADYLERGVRYAEQHNFDLLILQLSTPGGSVDIMNRMVETMRSSKVPIVVYVAPRGAMAASAGTVLTLAGHVAAMAPETAIGAASPVGMQGEDIGETLQRKAKEMLKATVRALAERRGSRASALAEQTIETAKAVSGAEALEIGLIDIVAVDLNDLLRQLDGFSVQVDGTTRVLHLASAQIQDFPNSLIESLLITLTNPNIVFLLLTIGVQAILIELSSPGGWVAGFIGVVCLTLAIYGLGVLPVNWFGFIFIITAFVLFILELKMVTHGALTTAGVISFIVGALVLFNSAETPSFQRVSPPLVIAVAVLTGATFALGIGFALRAQKAPQRMGQEALVGQHGIVREALDPHGQVQAAGELWSAEIIEGDPPLPKGTRVDIVSVEGVHLRVRRSPGA